MITILMRKHIRYDELGRDVCLFGLAVASASELPSKYDIDGAVIHEASIAWDVSVGKKYGFLDNGGWREQATVINPMTLKGRVNSIEDLPSNAVPGWVYFVGSAGSENLPEYMYTEDHVWDPIGSNSITIEIDSALSTTSENPVQNKVITDALSDKADKATTLSGYGIEDAKIVSGTITLGANTITPLTQHQDISGKADKATTLSGYGIEDAKITSGTITLGANTITPLTQHQDISGKADKVEQEKDRAALIEIVDSGPKNLSQWNSGTATGSGQTIGSQIPFTASGNLVVSFQSDVSTGYITLGFKNASNETLLAQQIDNFGTKIQEITLPSGVAYFNIVSSLSANYTNFMICTKAAWDISHAYQPYR